MFETTTVMRAYDIPDDGIEAHAFLLAQIHSARVSLRCRMYGFTDIEIADALVAKSKAGVNVLLLLDSTQEKGPTELAVIHRMLLAGFPPANICITTSTHHAIMHKKQILLDVDAMVPDAQYPSVDEATESGYPRVITGSTNWSIGGEEKQANDLLVMPGKLWGALCLKSFEAQWQWAMTTERHYQLSAAS